MYNEEINNKEMRKLTIAVIRVTEGFLGGEVLKKKIQEKALDIFAKSNPRLDAVLLKDIKLLKQFINLAKDLRLTKPINCEVLIREYNKLYEPIIDYMNFSAEKTDFSRSEAVTDAVVSDTVVSNPIVSKATGEIRKKRTNNRQKQQKMEKDNKDEDDENLTERQRKILKLFFNRRELQLRDIGKSLRNVTSRTLRNDLRKLVSLEKLKHNGAGPGSVYKVKSS